MLFESMLAIGAVLLIGSGGMKLFDRASTQGALRAAQLPSSEAAVITLAVVEILTGVAALTVDAPWAPLALAVVYVGFAGFVAYALREDLPIQSCGCFGRADTPPSAAHLVLNGLFALSGVGVAATGSLTAQIWSGTAFEAGVALVMASIGAYVSYLVLAELPALMRAVRGRA